MTHTPEGGLVEARTEQREKTIRISVFNQGDPIPQESMGLLWTPFYRTDRSRVKHSGGTGLGLAIVKEIIQAHKQNINVVSTEGAGTEFIFTLALSSRENA